MTCDKATQIQMYHDGALDDQQRSEVEAHLLTCADCQSLLVDLRKLSRLFTTVEFAEMPQRAMSRMYGSWHAAKAQQERGVRRLAGWLTGVAAAVLVLVPLHSTSQSTSKNDEQPAAVMADVAFVPPTSPREDANSDLVQVAQWMANDLSVDQGR